MIIKSNDFIPPTSQIFRSRIEQRRAQRKRRGVQQEKEEIEEGVLEEEHRRRTQSRIVIILVNYIYIYSGIVLIIQLVLITPYFSLQLIS